MKKNLRIVSATAAALLAVAPVAAASVAPVFAADSNVTVDGGTGNISGKTASFSLNVTNAYALVDGDPASSLKVTLANPTLPNGATISKVSNAKVYKVVGTDGVKVDQNSSTKAFTVTGNDKANEQSNLYAKESNGSVINYQALTYITIGGLQKNTDYTIKIDDKTYTVTANETGFVTDIPVVSKQFSLADATKVGAPYLFDKSDTDHTKAISNGYVALQAGQYSVDGIKNAITGSYDVGVTAKDNAADGHFTNLEQDIRAALTAAGITVKANGTFDKPAVTFPVTVNMYATNGKTNTAVITVDPNSDKADTTFPRITFYTKGATVVSTKTPTENGKSATYSMTDDEVDKLTDASNNLVNINYVPLNGSVDVNSIKRAFTATVDENNKTTLDLNVDVSKVNTKVAGKYPVVVSATNADKKTTKVTFMLTVGAKGATYKTVQSNGDVPVYKIDGNTVTDTKTTVKNGDTIAVFGDAIKIGDKSYTRINSADSDLYVESQYVDGSFKPAPAVAKKVMHNSYIYDANHKRVGTKTLAAYTTVNVYGDATKLADGSLVYKIGDNQYVMADNIDGTSRTLTHNAYVYKTSTKRADRRVLKKGAKVTTYGAPYKFKNGKSYYRIGGPAKQYVKVANF
ncbi:SLAP domain-containing protein [Lactobacillus sp. ESL0228]|uniref:SLAP domain-containing protein n=1 Tax=Lactobacillus sp. ESL0228 TaxID=2069352 RepID=UPI000EFCA128|nr:SLAP domain-containing protein [Lactobacillus sp. ESL0228]RMC47279.1 hypothetical protein F5ESL0228_07465 [Lactobacillus sp. ESL0228]